MTGAHDLSSYLLTYVLHDKYEAVKALKQHLHDLLAEGRINDVDALLQQSIDEYPGWPLPLQIALLNATLSYSSHLINRTKAWLFLRQQVVSFGADPERADRILSSLQGSAYTL